MKQPEPPLLVVVGPTASGKTELAVRLAERVGGEIVSADSVQVYRDFDIGANKPTLAERARAPHHLIDVVAADAAMDAARWVELAQRSIEEIRGRGRRAIVCGGTFLWVRALLYGLAPAPPGDAGVRAAHRERVESQGRAALWRELQRVDPASAARLSPNDFVRVSRALEVFELTRTPLSVLQQQHGFRTPRFTARLVGVERTREELAERIARRVHAMLAAGWLGEVWQLLRRGYGETRPMGAVGYRQIRDALNGGYVDLDELAQNIDRQTRIFARRQRTWLRDAPVEWLAPEAPSARLDEICRV